MIANILLAVQILINLTILLAVQVIFILLIRKKVSHFFGAVIAYRLWLLPLCWLPMLWFPMFIADWNIPGLASEFNATQAMNNITDTTSLRNDFGLLSTLKDLTLNYTQGIDNAINSENGKLFLIGVCLLWCSGIVIFSIKFAFHIRQFSKQVAVLAKPVKSKDIINVVRICKFKKEISIFRMPGLSSPAIFGLFKPVLILPENFSQRFDQEQQYLILSHEAIHYNRRDNLWNTFVVLIKIVFWVNPLLLIAYRSLRQDQELSCDAQALSNCKPNQSKKYAMTLLESMDNSKDMTSFNTYQQSPVLTGWGNIHDLKERMTMITQYQSKTHRSKIASFTLLIIILLGGGGLTGAYSANEPVQVTNNRAESNLQMTIGRDAYEVLEQVLAFNAEEDYDSAESSLENLKLMFESDELNDREEYLMWMFFANLAQQRENFEEAMVNYKKVTAMNERVSSEDIAQAYKILGQLSFVLEQYSNGLNYLQQHNEIESEPDAGVYLLMAMGHYELEEYQEAIPLLLRNIEETRASDETVNKSTYSFLSAVYFAEDDYVNYRRILEEMVELFGDEDARETLDNMTL